MALIPLAVDERKPAYAFRDLSLVSRALRVPKEFLIGFDAWQETGLAVAAAACVAVAFAGLVLTFPRQQARTLLLAGSVAAAGVVTPVLLAALGADYFNSLYVVGAIAPAVLVVAAAFSRTTWTRAAGAVLIAISLIAVVSVVNDPALQRTDWRGAAAVVAAGRTPRSSS